MRLDLKLIRLSQSHVNFLYLSLKRNSNKKVRTELKIFLIYRYYFLHKLIITITLIDKLTEIERENRLLLEKMSYIMQSEQNSAGFQKYSPEGHEISQQYDDGNNNIGSAKKSLNRIIRQRDLSKINRENKVRN